MPIRETRRDSGTSCIQGEGTRAWQWGKFQPPPLPPSLCPFIHLVLVFPVPPSKTDFLRQQTDADGNQSPGQQQIHPGLNSIRSPGAPHIGTAVAPTLPAAEGQQDWAWLYPTPSLLVVIMPRFFSGIHLSHSHPMWFKPGGSDYPVLPPPLPHLPTQAPGVFCRNLQSWIKLMKEADMEKGSVVGRSELQPLSAWIQLSLKLDLWPLAGSKVQMTTPQEVKTADCCRSSVGKATTRSAGIHM